MVSPLLALTLALLQPTPAATPPDEPVTLFLMDNSASLPPLDPDQKRVAALGRMFTFLQGQPFHLVLFGGRDEVHVDDLERYRNDGKWTDFYFALDAARQVAAGYPEGTEFRLVMLTDGVLDPNPADWADQGVPPGADLKQYVSERILALLREAHLPLYVVLVGQLPKEGAVSGGELAPQLVLDMITAANGSAASPLTQSLASFVSDDGVLFKKFVFRVAPYEGLRKLEPVIRRIVAPASAVVEVRIFSLLVLPLTLFLFLLLGALVRSFPGAGDAEIIELALGQPVHVAVDRLHKIADGWAPTGLSLAKDAKDAAATLTYRPAPLDLTGKGFDAADLDGPTAELLRVGLDDMKKRLREMAESGTKEERIYALNLDYMAKNLDAAEAERMLSSPASGGAVSGVDFVRAKAHLLFDDTLRRRLTDPRVHVEGRGPGAESRDLAAGARVRIGRYTYIVQSADRGGRKDVKLVLYYDRVPSLLGLKTWLPARFQRVFRMRRSSFRLVT